MVSKSRMSLNLRRHKKAFDVRFPAFYTSQEEFNWCSVAPTSSNGKPFGDYVEGLLSFVGTIMKAIMVSLIYGTLNGWKVFGPSDSSASVHEREVTLEISRYLRCLRKNSTGGKP